MSNKLLIIVGVLLGVGLIAVCIFAKPNEVVYDEELLDVDYSTNEHIVDLVAYNTDNPGVAMYIKKYGTIVIELYPEIAPNTVNSFISLVKSGFYDNNTFHRLLPGFVLQGGDPTGTGTGGPGYYIKGEFNNNDFPNNLLHDKWVVSMARASGLNDSAGSQFFICLDKQESLDNDYATFGKVIAGFDTINKIVKQEKIKDAQSGQLVNNLTIVKSVVDLQDKEYPEPEKITAE